MITSTRFMAIQPSSARASGIAIRSMARISLRTREGILAESRAGAGTTQASLEAWGGRNAGESPAAHASLGFDHIHSRSAGRPLARFGITEIHQDGRRDG